LSTAFPTPTHRPLENAERFPQPLEKPGPQTTHPGFSQLHSLDDHDPFLIVFVSQKRHPKAFLMALDFVVRELRIQNLS